MPYGVKTSYRRYPKVPGKPLMESKPQTPRTPPPPQPQRQKPTRANIGRRKRNPRKGFF